MFFNSGYSIEFYKPKEEVLASIENRLAGKFLDWDKSFRGRVNPNGFTLKYANWNTSPEIRGDFKKEADGKEKLWLTISLGSLNLLGLVFASGFIFFIAFILTLFFTEYAWFLILVFYAFYIQFIRIQWISCKDECLQLLKSIDKLCTVSSI